MSLLSRAGFHTHSICADNWGLPFFYFYFSSPDNALVMCFGWGYIFILVLGNEYFGTRK